ncbi:MAG: CPBP family intramembrane metalloprotease [Lachnospiraceae bacterium]|nr:CPBP family intramembrane metalloprotease [Lachnospiraceae bacterium]
MRYDRWSMRVIRLLTPLAVYLLIGMLAMAGSGGYSLKVSLIEKLMCASAMTYLFQKDSQVIFWEKQKISLLTWLLLIAAGACAAVGLNALIFTLGLDRMLANDYETVTGALYGQELFLEFLVMVLAAPLAEELLFRGILYRRMRTYTSYLPAALITSLIFASFHGNILQGAYGFAVGILLTYVYELLHTIWAPVLLHAAANGISLLMTEIPVLNECLAKNPALFAAAGLAGMAAAVWFLHQNRAEHSSK